MAAITFGNWSGRTDSELAAREVQCLLAVAGGCTDKQAALSLGVSPRTVKGAIERAMHKLNAYRRPALVAEAMRRGLISPAVIALAFLVAGQPLLNDDHMMRSRRGGERRIEFRVAARRAETWLTA
ncbi:TPA: response regulator transcription factor [Pseudomonas aeruginosa]|nr:response regulator transcription factor [Pseudomonas aeruginosa]HEJ6422365.1 response regulator transcription factor [Pseudomonas aeruginosa]